MLKKIVIVAGLIGVSGFAGANQAEELTGDTKLACEAILCLSTSTRPSECMPSIRKFFSIHDKKPWKTIQKRKDFLALCPVSDSDGMPEYQDLLANNVEKCSADRLNRDLLEKKVVQKWRGSHNDGVYVDVIYYRINSELPNYCKAFFNHEYAAALNVTYQGSDKWVHESLWRKNHAQYGHWIDQ